MERHRLGVPVAARRRVRPRGRRRRGRPALPPTRWHAAGAPGGGVLSGDSARTLTFGSNLLRLRASVSGAEQVTEVTVRGWDYKAKEAVEGTARRHPGPRGAAAGQSAAAMAGTLGGGTLVKLDLPVTSAEVAQEAAESLVEQLDSAATELEGAARGNPDLRAGVSISLAGVARAVRWRLRAHVVPAHVRRRHRLRDGVPGQRPPEPHDARPRPRRRAAARRRRAQRARGGRPGHRQQPRRPRQARADEGHVPVGR